MKVARGSTTQVSSGYLFLFVGEADNGLLCIFW
jgi:hypothetical protein